MTTGTVSLAPRSPHRPASAGTSLAPTAHQWSAQGASRWAPRQIAPDGNTKHREPGTSGRRGPPGFEATTAAVPRPWHRAARRRRRETGPRPRRRWRRTIAPLQRPEAADDHHGEDLQAEQGRESLERHSPQTDHVEPARHPRDGAGDRVGGDLDPRRRDCPAGGHQPRCHEPPTAPVRSGWLGGCAPPCNPAPTRPGSSSRRSWSNPGGSGQGGPAGRRSPG